jgi:predicted dehydrogenase
VINKAPLRLGVVGCGFIGRVHLGNAVRLPEIDLVAVADINGEVASSVAREFKAKWSTTDGFELCRSADIEAVILATHPAHREALALEAIANGKHVFLEKPVTMSVAGTTRLADAARKAGVVTAVNFKFRAAPAFAKAAELYPAPLLVTANVSMPMLEESSPHMNPAVGGGNLPNLGSHVFDFSAWLMRSPVKALTCHGVVLKEQGRSLLDVVAGQLHHENGRISSYCISDVGTSAFTSKWLVQIADGASASVVAQHGTQLFVADDPKPRIVDETSPHAVGTLETLRRFALATRGGGKPIADVHDGVTAARMVAAAEVSVGKGGALVEIGQGPASG